MPDWLPARDETLRAWLINFFTKASAYSGQLALQPAQVADIQAKVDAFATSLDTVVGKKDELRSVVNAKDRDRAAAAKLVRELNKKFRTVPTATDEILLDLGLPVYAEPSSQTPKEPLNLLANARANGYVTFQFDRNYNSPRAVFVFEKSDTSNGPWEYMGSTMKTRVTFRGFVVGELKFVRVYAIVNNIEGAPSEPINIYSTNGGALRIAA